jgi:hypothetical protein
VDRLKQLGYRVVEVVSGGRAKDNERYLNKRAEMWGDMREWLEFGCIDNDQMLIDDLTAPEYAVELKGRLRLETKDSMKKRGLRSGNDSDALAFTFAEPVSRRDSRTTRVRMNNKFADSDYDIYSHAIGD